MQFGDESTEFQLTEESFKLFKLNVIGAGILQFEGDGHVGTDGGQFVAHIGRIFACDQFGGITRCDLINMGVDLVQGLVLFQQGNGSLFAYTGHTGNVI
ncbi:hypothetical protein SDC9_99546 [bioreactor metagenome]|uniref:Uncharacterized protein n=1 Tax=bioreactor metagenome TaxID=1076179 RepID=A0A645API2_9ZZZZ